MDGLGLEIEAILVAFQGFQVKTTLNAGKLVLLDRFRKVVQTYNHDALNWSKGQLSRSVVDKVAPGRANKLRRVQVVPRCKGEHTSTARH